jgi:phage-related tail protein
MASILEQMKVDGGDLQRAHEALEMLAYDAMWSREDLIVLLDHALAAAAALRADEDCTAEPIP